MQVLQFATRKPAEVIKPVVVPEGREFRERIPFEQLAIQRSDYAAKIPGGMAFFRVVNAETQQLEVYAHTAYFNQRLTVFGTTTGAQTSLETRDGLVNGKPSGNMIGRVIRYPVRVFAKFGAVGGDYPKPESYAEAWVDYKVVGDAVWEAYSEGKVQVIDHEAIVKEKGADWARVSDEDLARVQMEAREARAERQAKRALTAAGISGAPAYDPFGTDNGFGG